MKKWFKKNKWMAYLMPSFLFPLSITIYGLIMAIKESMTDNTGFSLQAYRALFYDHAFWASYLYSVRISTISTVLSLIIGILITRLLYQKLLKTEWKLLVWVPMIFPHFVWGYMVVLLLSQTGFISSIFNHFEWIQDFSQFPILLYEPFGIGIIVTYVWKEIPFVVLMLLPVYAQMNQQMPLVVKTLGGNEWNVFKTTEWPWVAPVLFETGIIIFAFILSAYEVPALLGTTYPKMLSVLSYEWFFYADFRYRPKAFALMVVVTMTIMTFVLIFFHMVNQKRYRMMKGNGR